MAKEFVHVLSLPASGEEKTDRQFVTSLARGLEVLRAFRPEDGPLGNQELAERTGLPKPTISRITHTLTTLGYLDYIPSQVRYVIAPAVLSLGHACVGAASIRHASAPHMRQLAEYADASVALGARDRLSMIYLDVERGANTVAFTLDAGAHIPIYSSAMGAAFLHALPEKDREVLLSACAKATRAEWPVVERRLAAAFDELDRTGFCVYEGIYDKAIIGVGTALKRPDGVLYSFSASGPSFQFSNMRMREDIGPRLVAMRVGIETSIARNYGGR
ncbi:MAG: IclR family transcriptional regulator [Sphingobium sp.]